MSSKLGGKPIWTGNKAGPALGLRLVAIKKPPKAAEEARRAARKSSRKAGHTISQGTLTAAGWVILVTSLPAEAYSTAGILALYRLRWRIELAFKRLKSLIGLKAPPGVDQRSAKQSSASVADLALELGVNETTIRRWKGRSTVADGSHTPKRLAISLTPAGEELVLELRRKLALPLDDLAEVMKRCVNAKLSRSAIHRCLKRHGLSRAERPASLRFRAYGP
jgi:hypothetical protein